MKKILIVIDSIEILWWAEKVAIDQIKLLKNRWKKIELYWTNKKYISLLDMLLSVFNLKEFFKLKKYLDKNRFDVIHVHKFHSFLSSSIFLAMPKDAKVVLHVHDFKFYCPKLWVTKEGKECDWWLFHFNCIRPIERFFILNYIFDFVKWIKFIVNRFMIKKYVDTFICPSRKLQEYMIKSLKLPKERVVHLPNFIGLEKNYYPNFDRINDRKFLFVWRLSKEKWVEVAIKAFDILVNKEWLKDITFEIIWDWPEKENLKNLVKKLKLGKNIKFLGRIENEKLKKYYENAVWLIMPSVCLENNPLVAIEWMKFWKPIIATNIWGYPDLVESWKNWFLFSLWNYIELAEKIKNLYKNKNLSIEMWKYWFEKLKNNLWTEKFYKKLMEIYKN